MGGDYYYFCSQLPTLRVGVAAPFSLAEFDARVKGLLPEAEAACLLAAVYPPDRSVTVKSGSVYDRYREWEFALRGEIARQRAAAGNTTNFTLPPESDGFASLKDQVASITSAPNPLERQKRLDLLRWQKLDDLESGVPFSREMVVCYRIRLAILEKYREFREDFGRENFEEAVRLIDGNSAE